MKMARRTSGSGVTKNTRRRSVLVSGERCQSPKAPAPSRETARFQGQFRWQYVGAQEGIRGHAKGATRGAGRTSRSFARRRSAADVGARSPLLDEPRVGRAYPAPLDGALQRLVVRGRERLVRRVERRERRGIERRGRAED